MDNLNRIAHRKELVEILETVFREKTSKEWLEILEHEEAILSGPVATYDQIISSVQAIHDNIFFEMEHPLAGKIRMPGFGPKFNATPAAVYLRPPLLGEHTKEILHEFGFGKEEISDYFKENIVR